MKQIINIALIFFGLAIQQNAKAQIPAAGSYTANTTMGAFHGTWQWTSGNDTVKIYLATKPVYFPISGGFTMERLVGWHLYKRGNTVIESSYNYINNVDQRTMLGGNNEYPTVANIFFKDISKGKDGELTLKLNAAQNQLIWRSTEHQGMRIYGGNQTVPPAGLTLPRNMVLTKL
jgi:hypothetical protein